MRAWTVILVEAHGPLNLVRPTRNDFAAGTSSVADEPVGTYLLVTDQAQVGTSDKAVADKNTGSSELVRLHLYTSFSLPLPCNDFCNNLGCEICEHDVEVTGLFLPHLNLKNQHYYSSPSLEK